MALLRIDQSLTWWPTGIDDLQTTGFSWL